MLYTAEKQPATFFATCARLLPNDVRVTVEQSPKDEPLNQLLPLVEFSFDTPRGQNTVATMNPGLAYVAVAWQLAAEVIVPLNREAGNSTGFRAQLLFFLDDLIPKLFDKPLLSDKPDRSLIAWD